jgi:hypothetical protein
MKDIWTAALRGSGTAGYLLVSVLALDVSPAASQSERTFSFAIVGDIGYFPEEEPGVENLLADMNQNTSLAFVVHVGDLARPQYACTNALLERRLKQFRSSTHPLIYTPGDNDWTDCHEPAVKASDPFERLSKIRALFFAGDYSFGSRAFHLTRQSDSGPPTFSKFRENVRWEYRGVTFVTLHVVGSNNGLGQSATGDAEFRERNAANLAWLRGAFDRARSENSRAMVILQQANIFPDLTPAPAKEEGPSGSAELRELLTDEVRRFGKPVLLVHGDTHFFRIDNPLAPRAKRGELGTPALENFTRVETYGTPYSHWVQISVDATQPSVFSYQSRIVGSNVTDRPGE